MKAGLGSTIGKVANVFWGQIFVAAAAFAGIRIYTELLSPAEFGTAMLALGALALLDGVGTMALNQTLLSRCGPLTHIETRRQLSVGLARIFVRWVGPASFGIGILAAIILIGIGHSIVWALLPFLISIYVIAEAFKFSLLSLIVLSRQYTRYSSWMAGEALLSLCGTVVALAFWRTDAIGFIAGFTLSRLLSATAFILILAPKHLHKIDINTAREDLRAALSYGIPVALMGPLGWISTYIDRYILGALMGTVTTGVYVAVTGLVARPYALTTAVLSNYFRPLYFQPSLADEGAEGCLRILRNWVLAATTIGLGGATAFFLLGDWIARLLLAADFRDGAAQLMALFAISQTFAITTHAADNMVLALRGSRKLLRVQIVLSVSTLLLIPAGIAVGGIVGGVIGRCVAEAVKLGAVLILAHVMVRRSGGMSGILQEKGAGGAV